jgi:hypothetical protein
MLQALQIVIPCMLLLMVSGAGAQTAEPTVKKLASPADPLKKAELIGKVTTGGMLFQLELEGSEEMWALMGNPPIWGKHAPRKDERYHVEFKLTDPNSKTRIPYANITFTAVNRDNNKKIELHLPPMWGSTGLHYSANSALAGDGAYAATVTVDVPTFQREFKDRDLWAKSVSARFHFRLEDSKLTEVSQDK